MRGHEPNTRSVFGPSSESLRHGLAARTLNFYLRRRRILFKISTAPLAARARPGIATLGSISGTVGTGVKASASFELVSATERTTSDRRMRDHFLSMVDLSAIFGVCDAPSKHFREEQKAMPKSSLSAKLMCPK